VTYREVEDLSHTYPRELNGALLSWLETTPSKTATPAA
jgi:phospholipase/carboxylesterase